MQGYPNRDGRANVAGKTGEVSDDALMSAVVARRYGPLDVLRVEKVLVPDSAPGEILVRVVAVGLKRERWWRCELATT